MKLCFYVPESHLETVKEALFAAGAGRIGLYEACCWQTRGQGQFRALEGSAPYVGQEDQVTYVDEFKVEMVCEDEIIQEVVQALRHAHPYEEPAFDVLQMVSL